VLAGGLIFVGLLGVLTLTTTGRAIQAERETERVAQLVAERTRHLDAAIREREVLLKEIHHRVKNNLQVISSLLGLQAHHVRDVEIRAVLEESRTRVLAIALVHENLYQTDDLSEVGLDTYLRSLLANLAATYDAAGRGIEIAISAAGVHLPVNVAIPCGLIIGELVTNAFKHAFPTERRGRIGIEVTRAGERAMVLIVGDDGVGLPPAFEVRPSTSLGMDLVHTFAEQLGATLEIGAGPGTTFTLRFDPGAPDPTS
jgi:two-component sensor histidine kinase